MNAPDPGSRPGCRGGHEITGTIPHPTPNNPNPLPKTPAPFIPTFRPHAILRPLPLPDGPSNVLDQAGGRPFGICRNVRQVAQGGGGHRGSAGGRSGSAVQSQPPGRYPFSRRRSGGRKRNIRSGPVADMTGGVLRVRVRAGPRKPLPRSVQTVAGAIRAGTNSRGCKAPSVGCGHHPAILGPRACCATHTTLSQRQSPRAALRTFISKPPGWRARGFGVGADQGKGPSPTPPHRWEGLNRQRPWCQILAFQFWSLS